MKITHIGHASILVEGRGLRVLSDPWWRGPCFGAQWWIYPQPYLDAINGQRLDYIYISHGHEDHFHPPTLRTLDPTARLLVPRGSSVIPEAKELGFAIVEVDPEKPVYLGQGVLCRIMPTYGGDSLLTLTDGNQTLVNLNDALHALPAFLQTRFIKAIKKYHPKIDYLFCGYGVASHFPNCYVVPGKDREASAQKRQLFFNQSWARIVHRLAPRFAFPFAADVVLVEQDLLWANEPVHNTERPTAVFQRLHPGATTQVLDIRPGFCIADDKVEVMRLQEPLRISEVVSAYADKVAQANRYGPVRRDHIKTVEELLRNSIDRRVAYFASFPGNYKIVIRLRNTPEGFLITKQEGEISVIIVPDTTAMTSDCAMFYTTRLAYLQRSLTIKHGSDLLFVGSGGVFEYPSVARLSESLHQELMLMLSPFTRAAPRWLRHIKSLLKRLLNRDDLDLYDLRRWTIFRPDT